MENSKSIHFIINPNSGNKRGLKLQSYLNDLHNPNYTVKISTFAGEAIALAQESIQQKADVIVSCGGDGTLREVASEMVGQSIPLAIIPIGSGNGLARNLGIPFDFSRALALIEAGKISSIDVGSVNKYYFFSNFGLGIDSQVIDTFSKQKIRGLQGYVKSSTQTIFTFKPIQCSIRTQDLDFSGKIFLLNIANANQIGYNFTFSPNALLNDGLLNVLLVKKFSGLGWLEYAWYFMTKKLKNHSKAISLDTEHIQVEVQSDFCKSFQIDGDSIPLDSRILDVRVHKNSLNIIS